MKFEFVLQRRFVSFEEPEEVMVNSEQKEEECDATEKEEYCCRW